MPDSKALLICPLGDLDKYEEITYIYGEEKKKAKLPVLWLTEKLCAEKILFIITDQTQNDYYSLFEKLAEFILGKPLADCFTEEQCRKFRRKENFSKDKTEFIKQLSKLKHKDYDFLTINEERLSDFIETLEEYLKKHQDYTIHIDITHGYRFIPMFLTIILVFLKNAGINVNIGEILYAYGEDSAENPIIKLDDYIKIIDWSHSINVFRNTANILPLADLLEKHDREASTMMEELQYALDMNLAPKIREMLLCLKGKIAEGSISFPSKLISDDVNSMLENFILNDSLADFELSLSKWHLKNKRFLHGYTALIESIITKICEIYHMDLNKRNDREIAKCIALSIKSDNKKNNYEYKSFIEENIESNETLKNLQKSFSIFYQEVGDNIRNTLAHIKEIDDENQLNSIYKKIKDFATNLNPAELNKNINEKWQSLEEMIEGLKRLPVLFSLDKLKELSIIYKNMSQKPVEVKNV
jgi:CRISPR-associated Csx2 family protein